MGFTFGKSSRISQECMGADATHGAHNSARLHHIPSGMIWGQAPSQSLGLAPSHFVTEPGTLTFFSVSPHFFRNSREVIRLIR
jgi:hypothetical protein